MRDAPEFAEEEKEASDEIVIERTKLSDSSSGIVDSIKRLNSTVQDSLDDDEEFLRMLKNVSSSDSDMSSTDEFEIVYDGKKRK